MMRSYMRKFDMDEPVFPEETMEDSEKSIKNITDDKTLEEKYYKSV